MADYWYHITDYTCIVCREKRVEKERRYTEKPEDPEDRKVEKSFVCREHFTAMSG